MSFLLSIAKTVVGVYLFLYVLVHALVFYSPETVRYIVFQNNS